MPSSILDIGIGNGKMGFIARDFLDVMLGQRHKRKDWKIKIDGIEIFSEYIQEHQKAIYDSIYTGDAFESIDAIGSYDLIIIGDVLEHLEKRRAWEFLDKCAVHCSNHIILNIPLGEKWTQPAIYGNPYEEHLSFWSYEEIEPFASEKELFLFQNIGYYGCILIKKDDYIHHRIRERADILFSEGKGKEAISYMTGVLSDISPDIKSEFILADLLLKEKRLIEARERLERLTRLFPEEESVKYYLEILNNIVSNLAHEHVSEKY
jgi:tetratricopeptide (TPR) repeat protein